jgi:Flp pilus assembly protein TadG
VIGPGAGRRRGAGERTRRRSRGEHGQATVELALVLPVVVLLVLGVVQVALVGRDQVAVAHAAREAARVAAVDPSPAAAVSAARAVVPGAVVLLGPRPAVGGQVQVTVRATSRTDVPLIGPLVPDAELEAVAVMRVER